jgi:hypothetical protein
MWPGFVWTSYLHTPAAWAERKASWFARLSASQNATTYLDGLEERYRTTLQTVLDGWEANEFAEIVIKDGKAAVIRLISWRLSAMINAHN